MTDYDPSQAKFPARLSRRLALAAAIGVAAFLVVGGFSVVLSLNIAHLHRTVDDERQHMQKVDEIDQAFHHLIFEIQQVQLTGKAAMWDLRELHGTLVTALDRYLAMHPDDAGLAEDIQERAALRSLSEHVQSLRSLVETLAGAPPPRPRLDAGDIEKLSRIAHEVPEDSVAVTRPHETRITRLLQMSRRIERIILALYLAMFSIGGIVVVAAGWTLRQEIAVPLRGLAEATRRITEGTLAERIPVKRPDEIGQLSHSFNVMADRLHDRERDLRVAQARLERRLHDMAALHEVGNKILAVDGPKAILRTIVDTACANLGLDAAAVCVWGSDPGQVIVHATSGPDEAFQVRGGVVRREADCCKEDRHTAADCPVIRSEFARSHLALPLKRGGESVGTLCVAGREEHAFTAVETEFLAALTAQAAITFEHARLDAEVQRLAVLEERGRIARDMHDGLAQSVSVLHLRIRQAQAQVSPESSPSLSSTLEELATISGDMHDEIRRSISGLRIVASEDPGLVSTLAQFVREFGAQNHVFVEFSARDTAAVDLSVDATLEVIRIVQEALNNVRKHAETDRAQVRVEHQGSWLRVSVEDTGCGFDPAKMAAEDGVHLGLRGMQERADRCAGKLEVESTPGRGTRVVLSVPLETPS